MTRAGGEVVGELLSDAGRNTRSFWTVHEPDPYRRGGQQQPGDKCLPKAYRQSVSKRRAEKWQSQRDKNKEATAGKFLKWQADHDL